MNDDYADSLSLYERLRQQWIASAGDPSKIKQAQGTLTWAIIGLVFVLVSVLVVRTVINAL